MKIKAMNTFTGQTLNDIDKFLTANCLSPQVGDFAFSTLENRYYYNNGYNWIPLSSSTTDKLYKVEFGTGLPFTSSIQALSSLPQEKGVTAIVVDKNKDEITTNYFDGTKWLVHQSKPVGLNHFDFTYYENTASQNADAVNKNENDLSYNKETGDLYFLDSTKTWVHMNLNNKNTGHDVGFRLVDVSGDGNDDVYNVDGHRLMLTDASGNVLSLEHPGQAVPKQYVDQKIAGIPADDMSWETKKEDKLHNIVDSKTISQVEFNQGATTFRPNSVSSVLAPDVVTNKDTLIYSVDNANNHPEVSIWIETPTSDPKVKNRSSYHATNDGDVVTKGFADTTYVKSADFSSPTFESRAMKTGDTSTDKSTLKSGDLLSKNGNFYLYDGHNIYWIGTNAGVFEGATFTNYKVKIVEDSHSNFEQNNIILEIADNMNGTGFTLDVNMSTGIYGPGVNIIKRTGEDISLIGLNDSTGNYYNTNGVQLKIDKSKPSAIIHPTIGKQFKSTSGTFPTDLMNLSDNFIVQIVAKIVAPDSKKYEINLGSFELASIKEMQNGMNEPETIKRSIGGADSTFTINHTGISSTPAISELRITVLTKVHS